MSLPHSLQPILNWWGTTWLKLNEHLHPNNVIWTLCIWRNGVRDVNMGPIRFLYVKFGWRIYQNCSLACGNHVGPLNPHSSNSIITQQTWIFEGLRVDNMGIFLSFFPTHLTFSAHLFSAEKKTILVMSNIPVFRTPLIWLIASAAHPDGCSCTAGWKY